MFTGLIDSKAKLIKNEKNGSGRCLVIDLPYSDLVLGESIAVSGVCLTYIGDNRFDVSAETLDKTNLGALKPFDEVNLERAMTGSSRFGGHYVSGHVDTTVQVLGFERDGEYVKLRVGGFSSAHQAYLLEKASICLNGVSLTINAVLEHEIELMLVPHTIAMTTFSHLQQAAILNLEFDYMTRIIAHQLTHFLNPKNIQSILGKFDV